MSDVQKTSTVYVDYQQRAKEFSVGDLAFPLAGSGTDESQSGRVVAVYPAIGMVDLVFPWGSGRYPVESLQRVTNIVAIPPKVENSSVPGGKSASLDEAVLDRISQRWVKKALYWAGKDRHYRATKDELDGGSYACPKCSKNKELQDPSFLRPVSYKMTEGVKHRLYGCPTCIFLIKAEHIIGDPLYAQHVHDEHEHDHHDHGSEIFEEEV